MRIHSPNNLHDKVCIKLDNHLYLLITAYDTDHVFGGLPDD